jgi:hypothetical protein
MGLANENSQYWKSIISKYRAIDQEHFWEKQTPSKPKERPEGPLQQWTFAYSLCLVMDCLDRKDCEVDRDILGAVRTFVAHTPREFFLEDIVCFSARIITHPFIWQ